MRLGSLRRHGLNGQRPIRLSTLTALNATLDDAVRLPLARPAPV